MPIWSMPTRLDGWPGPVESDDGDGYGVLPDPELEAAAAAALAELEEALEAAAADELDADGTLAEAVGEPAGGAAGAGRAVVAGRALGRPARRAVPAVGDDSGV